MVTDLTFRIRVELREKSDRFSELCNPHAMFFSLESRGLGTAQHLLLEGTGMVSSDK